MAVLIGHFAGQVARAQNLPAEPESAHEVGLFDLPEDLLEYSPDETTGKQSETMPKRVTEYDRFIPGLGQFAPVDVRPLLARMGVEFQPDDYALADKQHGFLLMKGCREMLDAVDVITEPIGRPNAVPEQVWVTILISRVNHRGAMRLVRSCRVLCSHHQISWRAASGLISDTISARASIADDEHHGEFQIQGTISAAGQRIRFDQAVSLRTPEMNGQMLAAVPAADGNGTLELRLLAERCLSPGTSEMHDADRRQHKDLAKVLAAALERRPAPAGAGQRRPGLYSMPWLLAGSAWQPKNGVVPADLPRAAQFVPALGTGPLMAARALLQATGTPVGQDDVVLYSPGSGLLYVESPEPVHTALQSLRPWPTAQTAGTRSCAVTIRVDQGAHGIGGRTPAARQLLVMPGSGAFWQHAGESIWAEAHVRTDGATDVGVALHSVDCRRSGQWNVNWHGTVHSDGRPLLIAQDARPFRGITRLLLSAEPPLTRGAEFLPDPERTAAMIREIQNQLKTAQ